MCKVSMGSKPNISSHFAQIPINLYIFEINSVFQVDSNQNQIKILKYMTSLAVNTGLDVKVQKSSKNTHF